MTNKPVVDYEKILNESGMPTKPETVRAEFEKLVAAEGLITNQSRMSPFWRLITAIVTAPFIWLKDILIDVVLKNSFLATASGSFLDLFAWAVNLTRKPASAAKGRLHFYKTDSRQTITIKAGTLVQSERIDSVIYQLRVIQDTAIAAGDASGLVDVEAVEAGAAWNLAPGYYRILPAAVQGIASVNNEENWLIAPGDNQESDEDLRARSRNQFNLVGSYHTDAVYRGMISSLIGLNSERIYFIHDAPRGPGTANAYLLLDTGVISDPFVHVVNDYVMAQGHHGHGDDLQCFAIPETHHELVATIYIDEKTNLTASEGMALKRDISNMIRCAFRENAEYDVYKTWPYSRFSFSRLAEEIHQYFTAVDSVVFSLSDIKSDLSVPRLSNLTVDIEHG